MSRAIFVIGPQGSGSSAVAGSLHSLGINMGNNLGGKSNLNPKGHFECLDFGIIYKESEKIEEDFKTYTEIRNKDKIWGIKSPRIPYYIQYIIPHVENSRVISIDRPFEGCVRSSMAKYPQKTREEIESWHSSIRESRDIIIEKYKLKNLDIDYNDLTNNIEKTIKEIMYFCFDGMDLPSDLKIMDAISFIDPSLNHKRELQCTDLQIIEEN